MADPTPSNFVAHEADLSTLKTHWEAARNGTPQIVHLTAPIGGGKRALSLALTQHASQSVEDLLVCQPSFVEEEEGFQQLMRLYAALFSGLHQRPRLRGKVEMSLNAQIPQEPPQVQNWYRTFIDALKKSAPKPGENKFQMALPPDPLTGFVEIVVGISRKFPMVLNLQNIHNTQSLGMVAMIEALLSEVHGSGAQLLVMLGTVPLDGETEQAWVSAPLQEMLTRSEDKLIALPLKPWGTEQVEKYLASKEWTGDAANIARIASGRPFFIADLCDMLHEQGRLDSDLSDVQLDSLANIAPDADELMDPEDGSDKRTVAGADDAEEVAFRAALLGLNFPSGIVADTGNFNRDSIDDLLDATEGMYSETQRSEPLQTWVYKFNRAICRESILARHTSEEDNKIAQQVGVFMERLLAPRAYGFLIKTIKTYADHGAGDRAKALRERALSADQAQMWPMLFTLMKYFDEQNWPKAMQRVVYLQMVDRMAASGKPEQAEKLFNEAFQWAEQEKNRNMMAHLLMAGSRLDHRRQDLYRARDRANDALKIYGALEAKLAQAQVLVHLARIELADGHPNAARDKAVEAEELAPVPQVQAHTACIRGVIARRSNKIPQAIEHFRKGKEIATKSGQASLAMEAGLSLGETFLVSKQAGEAADNLLWVSNIARQTRVPTIERQATALLGQARASLKQFEGAIEAAKRTLELTRGLKFARLEAVDLYNLGLFHLMNQSPTEAISLFREARGKADATNAGFLKELLFNMGGALIQIGEKTAGEEALKESLAPSNQSKDWRKVIAANQRLAHFAAERGNKDDARTMLEAALQAADKGKLREERKKIRQQLNELN